MSNAETTKKITKAEIIQWIKEYERPIDDVTKFTKELGDKIKMMDFTASNNGAAIGYAGSFDGDNAKYLGVYITVGNVSENGGKSYSYINYNAENILKVVCLPKVRES